MIRALALMICLASPAAAQGFLTDLRGNWTGDGVQGTDTWQVALQVVPGGARVDYPDIPCGGVWVITNDGPRDAEGTEWLTHGQDLCIDGLRVVLSAPSKSVLRVLWLETDGTEIARADLSQPDQNPAQSGKSAGKLQ